MVWNWSGAVLGAVCTVPAGLVILGDVPRGLAFAFGVLPAAIAGIAPVRRRRLALVAVGVLTGVSMFLGGLLAGVPALAVMAIALLGLGSALLAARSRIGMIVMTLSLPLVGIGLSYDDAGEAAALGALMIAGGVLVCAVSMLWPERGEARAVAHRRAPGGEDTTPTDSPRPGGDGARPTLGYGIRLGFAGATAAALGFLLDLEHVGWACGAALLVMRPVAEMQRLRSVGRVIAVCAGALVGGALVRLDPPAAAYSAAAIAAVAGAAGTHASRWYVTPAFTTFLVFLLLLYSDPQDAGSRFGERVAETLLGVGIAYAFGLALPALVARRRPSTPPRA